MALINKSQSKYPFIVKKKHNNNNNKSNIYQIFKVFIYHHLE